MSLTAIDAALKSKSAWILRKLHHFHVSTAEAGVPALLWQDGMALSWLGSHLILRSHTQVQPQCWREGNILWVGTSHHDEQAAQMRHAVEVWAKRQALDHFTQRLKHFAKRLCVSWTRLSLSSARTRWGSAKSDGSIRLHWRLMQFPPAVLDYVVIHELAHLRHMNHGPDFWRLVEELEPNWPTLRQVLRCHRLPVW
jgi:predicted metal-dependent hydrolase